MVSESGAVLLDDDARAALVEPAAAARHRRHAQHPRGAGADRAAARGLDQEELARAVLALGPEAVVVTGGHSERRRRPLLRRRARWCGSTGERHPDGAAHGSGCTHSSALAAFLARGVEPLEAARGAREIASEAVGNGLRELGAGPGPWTCSGFARRGDDRRRRAAA